MTPRTWWARVGTGAEGTVGEGGGLEGAGEDGVDYKRGILWWSLGGGIKGVCVGNKKENDDETTVLAEALC